MTRYNNSVQFPDRVCFDRFRALALLWGKTQGQTVAKLVDDEIKKQGLQLGATLSTGGVAKQS